MNHLSSSYQYAFTETWARVLRIKFKTFWWIKPEHSKPEASFFSSSLIALKPVALKVGKQRGFCLVFMVKAETFFLQIITWFDLSVPVATVTTQILQGLCCLLRKQGSFVCENELFVSHTNRVIFLWMKILFSLFNRHRKKIPICQFL